MSPLQIAALVVAYLLAFARLFDAARPLWAWIPAKFQPLAPAVLAVIPAIVDAFRGVTSKTELTIAIMGALGTLTTAVRGALPAAHFAKLDDDAKDALRVARGGESKKNPPSKPPPSEPPRSTPIPPAFAACFLIALLVFACSGAQKPQPSGCEALDYAALSASCGTDEHACNAAIEERERKCADLIRSGQ